MLSTRVRYILLFLLSFLFISITPVLAAELNLIYDGNGNLITGYGKYREYDEFNRLIKVREGNNSNGTIMEEILTLF